MNSVYLPCDETPVRGPRIGTSVRNIHSGLKGKIIWAEGEVFKLDNPLARGHYLWNDSWRVFMEDLSGNGNDAECPT